MTTALQIYLLGDFRLDAGDGTLVVIAQARQQALLTYLLLHRHAPQPRRQLAFLLWPDSREAQALTNLRKTLTHLRQLAPSLAQALYADHQVVQWRPAVAFTLDVAEFEEKLAQATAAEQAGRAQEASALWAAAVAHYTGPLTPSCYDDWLIAERERLHQLCIGTLERLVTSHEHQHKLALAITYAQQLLRLDPLQETIYLQLMRLQALQGDRAGALRTYHTCATVLARELAVEPASETQAAYARLLKLETGVTALTRAQGGTRLVGRQAEWTQLQQIWRLAIGQGAQLGCLWGEAGIGKTHLAEAVLGWASQQGFTVAHTRAYAGEGQLAYAPVVEWLRAEPMRAVRQRLAPVWLSEVARLVPEILSEQPSIPAPTPMTEAWQRQRLWEALARALLAVPQPLLLVIDDLQWCDAETLEWLRYLLHFAPRAPLLVLGTARPEEVDAAHPLQTLCRHLRSANQLTELDLGPLDAEQTAALAAQVTQQPLADHMQQALYRATAGNPLFVVEMMRAGLRGRADAWGNAGSAAPTLSLLHTTTPLPPKVQAVIQARLAQLSPTARGLAHLAAVSGQGFTFELLVQASGQDEDAVVGGLDELWQRRIIREHGRAAYDFSHDRIRDVAYGEISPIRRRLLHERVAQRLETLPADELDAVCSQIANHYEQAGSIASAITYYQRAAVVAQRYFAYVDAHTYLNRLLTLLDTLPITPKHCERRLDVLLQKGTLLTMVKGFTAPEVEVVYNQAIALCQGNDQADKYFLALCGLWLHWQQRSQWHKTAPLEAAMLRLATLTADATHLYKTSWHMGVSRFHQGKLSEASDHLQRAATFAHSQSQATNSLSTKGGPGASLFHRLAFTFWMLGYPERAQVYMDKALTLARQIALPHNLLMTLDFALWLAYDLQQVPVMQSLLKEYSVILDKHPFPELVPMKTLYTGWLLAQAGEHASGIALLEQGLTTWAQMGVLLFGTYLRSWLIEAYQWGKQFEQGLAFVAETLALTEATGDQFWQAELYRLKGELLLAYTGTGAEAEPCFQQAIQVARQQQAKSLELRAVTSLARLWQQQGRSAEAYHQLAETYNWFTEGFDTTDLQRAKALLTELTAR